MLYFNAFYSIFMSAHVHGAVAWMVNAMVASSSPVGGLGTLHLYLFNVMNAIYVHGKKTLIHGMNPYLTSRFGFNLQYYKNPKSNHNQLIP